jgi:signal peptidase II
MIDEAPEAASRPKSARYEVPAPPPAPPSTPAGALAWTGLAAVALAALVADQITKSIATRALEIGDPVRLAPFFDLTRIHNTGIAFGQFTGQRSVITLLTAGAIVWMTVFFARSGGRHPYFPVALGLLVGGAGSNLLDRLRAGFVTDFLHIHHWPIFNLADTFIVVGVGLLLLGLAAHERARRP